MSLSIPAITEAFIILISIFAVAYWCSIITYSNIFKAILLFKVTPFYRFEQIMDQYILRYKLIDYLQQTDFN